MSDELTPEAEHEPAESAAPEPAPQAEPAPEESQPPAPAQTATVRTIHKGIALRGFILGAGQTVSGVSLDLAKHRESTGEITILSIP